ncbi:MAG: PSP1 domain-containing protein [Planctomycetota bacterium]|jgi:cell fate regulator YaaT (PSP1 superfamily)
MSKAAPTKPKQARYKKFMLVRYSRMNTLGLFEHHETKIPKVDTRVVIKTNKGLELGYLVGQLSSYRGGQLKFDSNQIKKYFDDSNIDISIERTGKFVRYATAADISEERHLQKIAEEEMECCRRFVKELDLPMKIVDAEHIFGGERVIFYFMSDGRVDFRELVKKIAHEYQTRIEMRQIGSRDEAKILGDVESCGQQCCCQRFLKLLKPVNMRMAKMQKATLDPSKISGYCGRLKCCLRYEDKTYTELKKRLPKKSARVKTKYGEGKVTGTQILTQLVMLELGDGQRVAVPLDELEVIPSPATAKKKKDSSPDKNQKDNVESKTDSQVQDNAGPPEQ